ncbi:hypothetical protein BIV23_15840 [Streptomyces monashensis]|uniref:Uncharacterized protein n=1 Tax=Streptomyces monashensis TaxID=1678012 RepID=A0A1S2QFA0_9ACTN|nr:hypothetical protein BIV23_15840 [Streptomyces monashensis]
MRTVRYVALPVFSSAATNCRSTVPASALPSLPVHTRRKPMWPAGFASISQAAVTGPRRRKLSASAPVGSPSEPFDALDRSASASIDMAFQSRAMSKRTGSGQPEPGAPTVPPLGVAVPAPLADADALAAFFPAASADPAHPPSTAASAAAASALPSTAPTPTCIVVSPPEQRRTCGRGPGNADRNIPRGSARAHPAVRSLGCGVCLPC